MADIVLAELSRIAGRSYAALWIKPMCSGSFIYIRNLGLLCIDATFQPNVLRWLHRLVFLATSQSNIVSAHSDMN